jgi:NitT/TauT family transport system permease protein
MTTDAMPARHATGGPSLGTRMMAGQAGPVTVVVLAILAVWYVACVLMNGDAVIRTAADPAALTMADKVRLSFSQDRPVIPAPHQVVAELWKTVALVEPTSRRSLVYHSWITVSSALLGFLMGTMLGIVLAVLIVHIRSLQKSLMPWIISSQTIPILAIAPIVIVVLGSLGITGILPKSIISTYLCFFPVTIGMVKGLTSPDPMQLDLMRTYNSSKAQTFWMLRWPSSVPFLFASLKVAVAISLVGAIVGELPTGAQAGLGARLLSGSYYGQTSQIWAALFMAAALAAGLVALAGLLERRTLRAMGARPGRGA